jgi:hypothetical protein
MELRKVADERDARAALSAVASSGLSGREWALAHGVSPRSLNMWRLIVHRKDQRQPLWPLHLVEITPTSVPAGARYRIAAGDYQLELEDDFRDDTLRRLLGVLRSC